MKLIIAGSRTVYPFPSDIDAAFDGLLFVVEDVTMVVSGRADGADKAGEAWAELRRLPVKQFPIMSDDAHKYGHKIAPKMRNRRMAEFADAALVWWDGLSGGTSDMVARMVVRDKPVRVIPMRRRK